MNPARTRLFGAILSAIAGGAFAQPSAQPAAGASQRIEVTGSMIKRIDSETTAPVSVISRDDIERSGATSIDELLRMSSLSGAGSLNDMDVGSGFAAGTASISLRGMGSAATLTLINGRRLTPAAVVDPNTGQSTIFNINTIPTSAIERIEILKAGASSLYGSDAIAGVVNIILRKDRQDRMLSLSAQQRPADGLFKTQTFGAAWGFGDLDKDRYNVSANLEVYKRDAVRITEAPDLVQQDLFGPLFARLGNNTSTTSYPGNLYSVNQTTLAAAFRGMLPGCNPDNQLPSATGSANNSCRNDADRFVEYVGKQDRVGASLRGTWNLSAQTTVNAELLASKVESTFLAAPPSRTEAPVFYGDGQSNPVSFRGLYLPRTHLDNPTRLASVANPVVLRTTTGTTTVTTPTELGLRYVFADIPAQRGGIAENLRVVLSANTTLGSWDVDAGLLHHVQKNSRWYQGRLSKSGLEASLASSSYRFGGVNSAAAIAEISRTTNDTGDSVTTSVDARGTRELGKLAGGAMQLGLGAELRHEKFETLPDADLARGDIIGVGIGVAKGSRSVTAAYAELQAPFIKGLETQFALRAENYTDAGSAVTGTLGAKYKITPQVAVRGTFATGFRAPSISQISKTSVFSFNTVQDRTGCPVVVPVATNPLCGDQRITSIIAANTALEPETAKSYTLGLLAEPVKDLELGVEAWYIDRIKEISTLSAQEMINREADHPQLIVRLPNGAIAQVFRQFRNLAVSQTGGIDFEAAYGWRLPNSDRMKAKFGGTRTITRKQQSEIGQPVRETLGFYGVPRLKSKLGLEWSHGDWQTSFTHNYQGRFRGHSAVTGSCQVELASMPELCTMKPWQTSDVGIVYKGIKGLRLSATLRNIQNHKPPFDPTEGDTGFDTSYANPYGRYLSVSARYEF